MAANETETNNYTILFWIFSQRNMSTEKKQVKISSDLNALNVLITNDMQNHVDCLDRY